ncbi:DUF389 domain-containing protein [Paeniglutamicibacter cryotolerans]|uniref:Putative hydrophobic protein (TIGR00271 family) n=1 Tax=Paeniglutamicibacter cryotolerans TaxID=670079 RepID=A0A839QHY3_9MICC|nr:DUF389 domain-containing protein [Paeniglutamicibacter cryotolerans]MBB2995480.1 putative hydrophobic protein (TIGR00271 family) [Paeniglutamicibacter cryotolerans]
MDTSSRPIRNDIETMRNTVLFDGPDRGHRLSRFWMLLTLSSMLAAAGVVADSTATVIGAIIVAPMLLPIQGTTLATVLGDRTNLVRSVLLVILGAAASLVIGYLIGLVVVNDVVAETNSQVASRVSPGLIDILAALGTGVVGSIALVRRDISDTLPVVAIAISLVPPLVVVGLALEAGAYSQSLGALLLFVTNVTAILAIGIVAIGIVVMALYGIYRGPISPDVSGRKTVNRRKAVLVIFTMMLIVGIPLTISSIGSSTSALRESAVRTAAETWTRAEGWDLLDVTTDYDGMKARVTGPLPIPGVGPFKKLLVDSGIDTQDIDIDLVPSYIVKLEGP